MCYWLGREWHTANRGHSNSQSQEGSVSARCYRSGAFGFASRPDDSDAAIVATLSLRIQRLLQEEARENWRGTIETTKDREPRLFVKRSCLKGASISPYLSAPSTHRFLLRLLQQRCTDTSSTEWLRYKHYIDIHRAPKRPSPKSTNELVCFWVFQQHRQRASSRVANCRFVELEQRRPHLLVRFGWWTLSKCVLG
jgi:hypothetical protein